MYCMTPAKAGINKSCGSSIAKKTDYCENEHVNESVTRICSPSVHYDITSTVIVLHASCAFLSSRLPLATGATREVRDLVQVQCS